MSNRSWGSILIVYLVACLATSLVGCGHEVDGHSSARTGEHKDTPGHSDSNTIQDKDTMTIYEHTDPSIQGANLANRSAETRPAGWAPECSLGHNIELFLGIRNERAFTLSYSSTASCDLTIRAPTFMLWWFPTADTRKAAIKVQARFKGDIMEKSGFKRSSFQSKTQTLVIPNAYSGNILLSSADDDIIPALPTAWKLDLLVNAAWTVTIIPDTQMAWSSPDANWGEIIVRAIHHTKCGDGLVEGTEVCDTAGAPGCSTCRGPDEGYECTTERNVTLCNEIALNCVLGPWGDWSPCSRLCAGGTQERRAPVLTPARGAGLCQPTESRSCNRHGCLDCGDTEVCSHAESGCDSRGDVPQRCDCTTIGYALVPCDNTDLLPSGLSSRSSGCYTCVESSCSASSNNSRPCPHPQVCLWTRGVNSEGYACQCPDKYVRSGNSCLPLCALMNSTQCTQAGCTTCGSSNSNSSTSTSSSTVDPVLISQLGRLPPQYADSYAHHYVLSGLSLAHARQQAPTQVRILPLYPDGHCRSYTITLEAGTFDSRVTLLRHDIPTSGYTLLYGPVVLREHRIGVAGANLAPSSPIQVFIPECSSSYTNASEVVAMIEALSPRPSVILQVRQIDHLYGSNTRIWAYAFVILYTCVPTLLTLGLFLWIRPSYQPDNQKQVHVLARTLENTNMPLSGGEKARWGTLKPVRRAPPPPL